MKKLLLMILMTLMVFMIPVFSHVKALETSTIRVWFSQYEEENEALRLIAEQYQTETGIKVDVVSRINIFNAVSDLVNNATLDERPDLIYMQAPDIGALVSSGYLESLNTIVNDELKSRYTEVALSAFKLNGEYYGVGYSVDSYGLIYNKDIIHEDELPKTWDEFFEVAAKKTIFDGETPVIHGTLLNSKDMWFNYPLLKSYGGYYYGLYPNGEFNPYDIGLDNPGMLDYISKINEAKEQGLVLTNKIHGESEIVSRFANGKVGMIIYGLWYASTLQDRGINYGIASLPDQDNENISKALTTVQGFVMNKFSLEKEASLDFLEYILTNENQQLLIEAGNNYEKKLGTRNPANLSVIQSDYIKSSEVLSSLSELNEECEAFPNIPEGRIWYNYTSQTFQSIFFSDEENINYINKLTDLTDKIRDDVRLMNYRAERIEIPSYIFLVIIIILLLVVILYCVLKKKRIGKIKSYMCKPKWKTTLIAWALITPLMMLLLIFYVYPIFHNFYLSLTDYSGINLRDYGLIGFSNYRSIFLSGFEGLVSMTIWTFGFAISVVVVSFILGVFISTLLQKNKVNIAKIYRIIFILPWVIPTVITLLMWQGLLETEGGLVNQVLSFVGIDKIPWLSNPMMAKFSTILVMTWFSFPYFMVVSSGLIQSIPKDYYDAAKVDGANSFYLFFCITLPLVFKAMVPTLIMSFIMQFNQFGVYILTAGGPVADKLGEPGATDLLITYVFNTAFNTGRYAVAAAYSVIIFVFIALFAIASLQISRKAMDT